MNLGDLHQVWEIKEWSDQLGIWAMPASHHSTGTVLALRRVLRGMRVYALWVLAGCFLCLYGQDLRSFTFLLDRQSLKSRGIRFPGRDNESLAPIFTPPRSISAPEVDASLAQQLQHNLPLQSYTVEQTKEAFDVARNIIELLTTVLSSSPQQDALKICT